MVKTGDFNVFFQNVSLTQPILVWKYIPNVPYLLTSYWHDVGDRRVDDCFWIKHGPLPMIFGLIIYLLFTTRIGPKWMKHRPAFNLRPLVIAHNFIMTLVNFRFFLLSFIYLDYLRDLFKDDILTDDRDDVSELTMFEIRQGYWYYWSKWADLLDTIFLVLTKKQDKVTMLHLYHHTFVLFFGWPIVRVISHARPIGVFTLYNSLIHTIMYTYYGLAAFGSAYRPSLHKYLWWKKYLTQLQLSQFIVYEGYAIYCLWRFQPVAPLWCYRLSYFLFWPQPIVFFAMFLNFYIKAYYQKQEKKSLINGVAEVNNNNNIRKKVR